MDSNFIDPVQLTVDLIRCQSLSKVEAGALEMLETHLTKAGFRCVRIDRNGTPNLFARFDGPKHKPTFGFNGHTDVVPPGDRNDWTHDPFEGVIADGILWGRGAADMKSGVAAFVSAAIDFTQRKPDAGSIAIMITGDEEGEATDGTIAIMNWMAENDERLDGCLVGEPTCPRVLGEMVKIGRRGSLYVEFELEGKQGHTGYPHKANNAAAATACLINNLTLTPLDEGSKNFEPSSFSITSIDTGNPTSNIIPGRCRAAANLRFNDQHTSTTLLEWLKGQTNAIENQFGVKITMKHRVGSESFFVPSGALTDLVSHAIESETGLQPELSTSGGTSDARFIKDICQVVEFGIVGATMHQVDEHVRVADIRRLKSVYEQILDRFFVQ